MALSRDTNGAPGSAVHDAGLARLYQEAGRDEPPAHLDAAVLAAARREVGAKPRPLGAGLRRWRVPVSIAAVVVLSVSVVTLMREEGGGERPRGAPSLPHREETVPPAPTETAQPEPARPASAPVAPAQEERRSGVPAAAPAAAARKEPETPLPAREDAELAQRAAPTAATAPLPFPAAPAEQAAVPAPRVEPDGTPRPAAVPEEPARARSEPRAPRSDRPASAESAKPAPAAPRESGRAKEAGLAPDAVRPGMGERPPVWLAFEREPPQRWLERIEELRREGQTGAAEEMLAEFKRRFPRHPLPGASR